MKSFFVSSTFCDMQAERDILHQRVFPRIRKQLEPYGEDIEGLDLRWGVDTSNMSEKESGKHVVKICIDTIDRCKPYMIILIGERYGWIYEIFNVSAADYHKIRVHMMKTDGWSMDAAGLSQKQMELLAELEHIRWCRYHQFHNWRMGIPKNGARKDATLRIHKDLIPYDELTEEEKKKDKDNIRMLQKLFAES